MRVVVFLRDKLPCVNAPTGKPFRLDSEKSGSPTERNAGQNKAFARPTTFRRQHSVVLRP